MIRPHGLSCLFAVLAALLVVGFGCTPKKPVERVHASPEAAWQAFRRNYCQPPDEPGLLIKASLYYSRIEPIKRTNRTLVSMWGNFDGPMRLDVSAGMGKLFSHIREDRDGLLVFYPTEKTAYAHVNPVLGATRLGMPFPFSLIELARVAVGDFSGLVPAGFAEGRRIGEGYAYTVHGSEVTSVTLDETGRPVRIEGVTDRTHANSRTWLLDIDKYEEEATGVPLPQRLTLAMDNGERGVLRIKSRQLKVAPWPQEATGLELPEDTIYRRLDNGYVNQEKTDIPVVYEDKS